MSPDKKRDQGTDPNRAGEQRAVADEVSGRLRDHGIDVTPADRPDQLADLLSAVERFERAVELHGGDLMVDNPKSSRPDDRHFVVPRRSPKETVAAYIGRIDEATAKLRGHPRHPD